MHEFSGDGDCAGSGPAAISVVGASGFIGGSLTRALSAAGFAVHGFTRSRPFADGGRLHPLLRESPIVYYVATGLTPAIAAREPHQVTADNARFHEFLRGIAKAGHRPLVVYTSSGGTVYDPAAAAPYAETAPIRATTAYGEAKLAQEADLLDHADSLHPVILRLANVYGPGQRTDRGYGVIGHWMQAALAKETIKMMGDPGSRRDYVHVTDVVGAMIAVLRRAAALSARTEPAVFNIGSGRATSLEELHRHLEYAVDRPVSVRHEPSRAFDRRDVWQDVRHAVNLLGWMPRIGLTEGLADTWYSIQGIYRYV